MKICHIGNIGHSFQMYVAVWGLVPTEADVKKCWLGNFWRFPQESEQGGGPRSKRQQQLVSFGNQFLKWNWIETQIGGKVNFYSLPFGSFPFSFHPHPQYMLVCSVHVKCLFVQPATQPLEFHLGPSLAEEETWGSSVEWGRHFPLKLRSYTYDFTNSMRSLIS